MLLMLRPFLNSLPGVGVDDDDEPHNAVFTVWRSDVFGDADEPPFSMEDTMILYDSLSFRPRQCRNESLVLLVERVTE